MKEMRLILKTGNMHYFEIVKALQGQYSAKFSRNFQTGTCALFFASQGGFLDIVKLLIDHGVPVDIPSYVSKTYSANEVHVHVLLF